MQTSPVFAIALLFTLEPLLGKLNKISPAKVQFSEAYNVLAEQSPQRVGYYRLYSMDNKTSITNPLVGLKEIKKTYRIF